MRVSAPVLAHIAVLSLLALPASAQEARKGFIMPLRADDLRSDPARDICLIRGIIERADGRTTVGATISRAHEDLVRDMTDQGKSGQVNVIAWKVEAGFCNARARRVELRK